MNKPANKRNSGKRGGKTSTSWKPGQSGNPKGRPKDGESWTGVIASVSNMTAEEVIAIVGKDNDLGVAFAQMPKGVQLKYLINFRVVASLMFEPTSGLWKELMERAEGKVKDVVDLNVKDEMTDDERASRLASILDRARARRDGQAVE